MSVSLETVVKQLEGSGIISPGKLENFIPPKAHPRSIEELVRELVKQKHLTKFQAQQVALGKARALLLGGYTIVEKIGAGGMGQVFKAVHRRMDRTVAIKILPPAVVKDPSAVARFDREVKAAAKLSHPNIVAAYDADEANGVHFLVMEYVAGKDLSALVKQHGPLPLPKALNYLLQAAKGLEFAHKKGVIHRDIKPANLLVDGEGTVKILDMGLARIDADGNAATQAELTGTSAVMGTVDYMAPEQALSTKGVDGRADIYSLGCTLHYLLVGKCTYDGETLMAKMIAHREAAIPQLGDVQTGISPEVQSIFEKMVAKRVEERYQSLSEVIADLNAAIANLSAASDLSLPATGSDTGLTKFFQQQRGATTQKPQPTTASTAKDKLPQTGKRQISPKHVLYGSIAGGILTVVGISLAFYFAFSGSENSTAGSPGTGNLKAAAMAKPAFAQAPFDAKTAREHQEAWARFLHTNVETTNAAGATMVLIPPGEFMMGSTDEEVSAALKAAQEIKADSTVIGRIEKAERPQRKVVIAKPLRMSATEVTVGQYKKFATATGHQTAAEKAAKTAPTTSTYLAAASDDMPAANITWDDAVAYCEWLSTKEKTKYRLPSEAEWEYACRAGTITQYSFGDDYHELPKYGWHNQNAGNKSHPVGKLLPNAFGLYDMHGNLYEWCGDHFDEQWYAKSPPNEPYGPAAGSGRVFRGGYWNFGAAACRSAYRTNMNTAARHSYGGFRCVAELEVLATASTSPTPNSAKLFMYDGAFAQWVKDVQAKPAAEQIAAVRQKLVDLNPGFDGKLAGRGANASPRIESGTVTELVIIPDGLTDLSPLRAWMGLKVLELPGSLGNGTLADLSPLRGMKLTVFTIRYTKVTNASQLAPLAGMPLTWLNTDVKFGNISLFEGMPLKNLYIGGPSLSDLSPLRGMPLEFLSCGYAPLKDLSPLAECPNLKTLELIKTNVTAAEVAALQKALPNCQIKWSDPAKTKPLFLHNPAFPQWVKDVQAKPAQEQLEVVRQKLVDLNPGFNGEFAGYPPGAGVPKIEQGVVTELGMATDFVTDVSPLRVFTGLTALRCNGSAALKGVLLDLSPLTGLPLQKLDIGSNRGLSDLTPIREMKLTHFHCNYTAITDLTILQGMPMIYLHCGNVDVTSLSFMEGMPLEIIYVAGSFSDLSPLRGSKLRHFSCRRSQVTDLSPIKSLPLQILSVDDCPLSDLSPLAECKTLRTLSVKKTRVTAAEVEALQKTLPDCKITWDDPATK